MTTVNDLITRAARIAGLAAADQPLASEHAGDCLALYNGLLHSLASRSTDLSHTTQAYTDTFAEGDEIEDDFMWYLAYRIALFHGRPASADIAARANNAWKNIRAHKAAALAATFDTTLTDLPSKYWGFSIYRR